MPFFGAVILCQYKSLFEVFMDFMDEICECKNPLISPLVDGDFRCLFCCRLANDEGFELDFCDGLSVREEVFYVRSQIEGTQDVQET